MRKQKQSKEYLKRKIEKKKKNREYVN